MTIFTEPLNQFPLRPEEPPGWSISARSKSNSSRDRRRAALKITITLFAAITALMNLGLSHAADEGVFLTNKRTPLARSMVIAAELFAAVKMKNRQAIEEMILAGEVWMVPMGTKCFVFGPVPGATGFVTVSVAGTRGMWVTTVDFLSPVK